MRSRSISVYTSPFPISKNSPSLSNNSIETELPMIPLRKAYSTEEFSLMFEDFGPMISETKEKVFTGDLENANQWLENTAPSSQAHSPSCDPVEPQSLYFDEILSDNEPERTQKILRSMVIGSKGSGRHSFVKNVFGIEQTLNSLVESQPFDVMTDTKNGEAYDERYLFWIKDTNFSGKRVDSLLDTYYKSCSVFFVIYDAEDNKSINHVEEELERITKARPSKQRMIILIDNNKTAWNEQPSKTSTASIKKLKEKFNVHFHFESNMLNEESTTIKKYAKLFMKQI